MTTIKINQSTKSNLLALKKLLGCTTFDGVVESLVNDCLKDFCLTSTGYAKIGDAISIDNEIHIIIDIVDDLVIAKGENSNAVTEFYKRGKIAWEATLHE